MSILCSLGNPSPPQQLLCNRQQTANHTGNVNCTRQVLCDRLDSEGIKGDQSRVIHMDDHPLNQLNHRKGQEYDS